MRRHLQWGLPLVVGAGIYAAMFTLRPPVGRAWDEKIYLALADAWANGAAGPCTTRPPLLWVTLGAAQAVGLDPYAVAITLNAVLCGLLVLAVVALASRLWHWAAGAALVALLFLHPVFWEWSLRVMSELLAISLTLTAVWALLARRYWLAGALLGLTALARPEVLGLVALFGGIAYLATQQWQKPATVAVCAALVVMPWTVRNYYTTHQFIPIASNGAVNIWNGFAFGHHSPGRTLALQARPDEMALVLPSLAALETTPYHFPMSIALDAARRNLGLMPGKALRLWWGRCYWNHDVTPRGSVAALMALGLVGIGVGLWRKHPYALLALCWLAWYTVVAMVTFPMERLQLVALPAFILGALCIKRPPT